MSQETPRTQEFTAQPRGLGTGYYQAIDFARQLERELNEAKTNAGKIFCPWCQTVYLKGNEPYDAILVHLKVCLKHPIAERDQLRQDLAEANRKLGEYEAQVKDTQRLDWLHHYYTHPAMFSMEDCERFYRDKERFGVRSAIDNAIAKHKPLSETKG